MINLAPYRPLHHLKLPPEGLLNCPSLPVVKSPRLIATTSITRAIKSGLECITFQVEKENPYVVQGLFVPFARVGSGDPVRVLRLFHNEYAG